MTTWPDVANTALQIGLGALIALVGAGVAGLWVAFREVTNERKNSRIKSLNDAVEAINKSEKSLFRLTRSIRSLAVDRSGGRLSKDEYIKGIEDLEKYRLNLHDETIVSTNQLIISGYEGVALDIRKFAEDYLNFLMKLGAMRKSADEIYAYSKSQSEDFQIQIDNIRRRIGADIEDTWQLLFRKNYK